LFGSGFGQDASTAKVGISPACEEAGAATSIAVVKQAEMALQRFWRARLRVGVIGASRCFFLAGYPAWEAVNLGEAIESITVNVIASAAKQSMPQQVATWIASLRSQ
jgi:hypothetical protein